MLQALATAAGGGRVEVEDWHEYNTPSTATRRQMIVAAAAAESRGATSPPSSAACNASSTTSTPPSATGAGTGPVSAGDCAAHSTTDFPAHDFSPCNHCESQPADAKDGHRAVRLSATKKVHQTKRSAESEQSGGPGRQGTFPPSESAEAASAGAGGTAAIAAAPRCSSTPDWSSEDTGHRGGAEASDSRKDLGPSSIVVGSAGAERASPIMEREQLVARLQRDLALALDSKQVSQSKYEELSKSHEKTVREVEAMVQDLTTARRQLAEAQRSEETCQNDLAVALRQGAKLSRQHEQSQADVATLKADVYKLGQQLLESMNAQDDLMDQSMLLLKQRDEAYRSRDEVRKELDTLREECTAAQEESQELRSRVAAKERLLQEQCRRMSGSAPPHEAGGGYSSSEGSHSDNGSSRQRMHELHQDLVRLRKEYKTICDECELLRQQCIVAKKERADSLNEQDSIVSRCYQMQQEIEGMKEKLVNSQQSVTKLKTDLAKAEQNLKVAQREKQEAQQSRDWAFEERSRIINERDMARADSTNLQRSRDKAVSDHVMTMRDADNLRHELDNVLREMHAVKALKDMYCTQLNSQAHYWQADYVTKEVQIRKGIDGQLGFTIGGGQDHPDSKLGPVIQIVEVVDSGPAHDVLKCDDLLVMINNQDLTNVTQARAAQMLREASSPLKIVLRRRGPRVEAMPFEISLQGSKDYGIQLESHIVVTGLTPNSVVGNKVQPGDRILKVDSMTVTNMDIGRVTHSIKATKRTNPIKLTLLRPTATSVRRSYAASTGRRTRSMGSGNSGPGVTSGPSVPSLGVPCASFGDSISNMVASAGERLSLDDGEYAVSSGHGTMSSTERITPGTNEKGYSLNVSQRSALPSVHSASSGSGDLVMPSGLSTSSSSHRPRRKTTGTSEKGRISSAPKVSEPAPPAVVKPASGSAPPVGRSSEPASSEPAPSQDLTELQPLIESVKHGEKRLQAIQQSRVHETSGGSDAVDELPSGDPRTKSMPASVVGMTQDGNASHQSRRPGVRRGSLPVQSQVTDQEHHGSISSNGSSSSGLAGGAGSGASSSIEAGVGGSDNIHNPAIRNLSSEGQRGLRFVVLSRNPTSGTLGFCIQGGNSTGIFISQITDAAASRGEGPGGGVQVGDRILEVNGTVLNNATREMAASCLRQSTSSALLTVKNDMAGYQAITQPYDSLWLRTNFAFLANHSWELTFPKNSLIHVIDTMPKKGNHWEASLFDSKGRATRQGMVPSRMGVKSGKLPGITSLDDGMDPFSEAEAPAPPASPVQGTPSTVF